MFLVGGPGHVVPLGLLVAGMAVPGRILGLLPRSLAWAGLVTAALAELTTLVLVWPGLGPMLPIARISALVWLLVAGAHRPGHPPAEAHGVEAPNPRLFSAGTVAG